MKQFLILLIASAIIGLACFGIFHFVFSVNSQDALTYALAGGLTGFIIEYIRVYFSTQQKKKRSSLQ